MTFWDFSAPFYDRAEHTNTAYGKMLRLMRELTPEGATVFEAAAGTGSISLAVAEKAKRVLCTDISKKMLAVARKKSMKQGVSNITFDKRSLFDTGEKNGAFDVVIASQVLHLIDEPEKAAEELKRISGGSVIVAVALLKGLRGLFARPSVGIWKLLGFAPKREFDEAGFRAFLIEIGLPPCDYKVVDGNMPIAVAVWRNAT
ncbi:MAG: class I SAM-dependent methyltransferase [Oscillospiraceae bacterium]|jgi:ubiquinone/menaquinone biosynthesis C-methylase UbiE|nr:class I SAM-dependent methyltransferase [Oscillospiraceae bacterium]